MIALVIKRAMKSQPTWHFTRRAHNAHKQPHQVPSNGLCFFSSFPTSHDSAPRISKEGDGGAAVFFSFGFLWFSLVFFWFSSGFLLFSLGFLLFSSGFLTVLNRRKQKKTKENYKKTIRKL